MKLEKIKEYINNYDNIYVIEDKNLIYGKNLEDISRHITGNCLMLVAGMDKVCSLEGKIDIQEISYEEYYEIEKLYFLYEFSDHIHLLTDHTQYGSLSNYIDSGLLTKDEAAMALSK